VQYLESMPVQVKPVCVPDSKPSPTPDACPKPDDVKIGFRAAVKKDIGYRNTFDLTPMFEGSAIRPESNCGEILIQRYGEFQRFQTSPVWGGGREPVELQSDNPYILVEATNSDAEHWDHGHFTQAGERTYCVSYAHLAHWRCQTGSMGDDGRLTGFGPNNQGFDKEKP